MPPDRHETQPSAEIVRVERAKCRRECDLVLSRATLCGDRACRVREMQARVRFAFVRRNPLRRSCVSRCAKCRRECDLALSGATLCGDRACRVREMKCRRECDLTRSGATLCGDRACRVREMQARVRLSGSNPLRRSCVSIARL